jgi:hypothetical protein
MVGFLFWNVKKQARPDLIRGICDEHSVDILALAEVGDDVGPILDALNHEAPQQFHEIISVAKRVRIFSRLPEDAVELISDDEYIFVRRIIPPVGEDALLVAVHLPSKMYSQRHEQVFDAVRVVEAIEAAEEKVGHNRTIVMGDLNMNPFEDGLVASDALHAVMDRRVAQSISRKVKGQVKKFMYNPMWKFFGNGVSGPAGTYFGSGGEQVRFYWHIFDQVLLRPDLLKYFSDNEVKIIDSVGSTSLLNGSGRINKKISDHLPIFAAVQLERML